MAQPKIFITQPVEDSALKRLQEVMDVEVHPDASESIRKEDLSRGVSKNEYLFNTSRGPVVDQAALIDAVRAKQIAGVALDVYEGEPHPELPEDFVKMKNVILTPHLGSAVAEKREIMSNTVVDIFLDFLAGKKPKTLFNPEVFNN